MGLGNRVAPGKNLRAHERQASQHSMWAADMFGHAMKCNYPQVSSGSLLSVCNMASFSGNRSQGPDCAVIAVACCHQAPPYLDASKP
jgi:hypothetical protein